jgi:hypothetical protein
VVLRLGETLSYLTEVAGNLNGVHETLLLVFLKRLHAVKSLR